MKKDPKLVREIYMYALGTVIVVGVIVLITLVMIYRPEMKDVINLSIGALLAAFGTVIGYFFGSSKGSADKNDLLVKNGKIEVPGEKPEPEV